MKSFLLAKVSRMKLKLLLFLLISLFIQHTAHAKSDELTERLLIEVLDEISRDHKVYFTYDADMIKGVTVDYEKEEGENVQSVLSRVLAEVNMDFQIFEERFVIIYRQDQQGLKSLEEMIRHMETIVSDKKALAEVRKFRPVDRLETDDWIGLYRKRLVLNVTGRVIDANGDPLIGVNILVKDTNKGTTTDFEGRFSLNDVSDQAVLIMSYIGYKSQEVAINGRSSLTIIMQEDAQTLDEVVVVGYGTQKKSNLTGAVSELSSKSLTNRPLENTTLALQGTMSGITIMNSTGQPGKNDGMIRIRGIGTLNNSNPMVVVDGIISTINEVNPDDIESISVMKDAASASIYGSRAANGVILITTKSGEPGMLKVRYNGYVGLQTPTRLPDFIPSWQQAELFNQVQKNENRPLKYSQEDIDKFKSGDYPDEYPNTDWLDLFYSGSGIQQNHHVSFSGGSDIVQYMFSLGYFNQEGIVKNSSNNRYTSRLNLSAKLGERLKIDGKISYTQGHFEEPISPYTGDFNQIIRQVNRIGRNVPYKYSNGIYGYIGDGNPIAWIDQGSFNNSNSHQIIGTANVDLKIFEGFHFIPMVNYRLHINETKKFIKNIQYYDPQTEKPTFSQGPTSLNNNNAINDVITLQALISYEKMLYYRHTFKLLGGYSQEYANYRALGGSRLNFLNNEISELNAGPTAGQKTSGSSQELALRSVFGRLGYDFRDKYLVEMNLRYDGSSRFSSQNRWGLFPSLSLGWNMSEEIFFDPLSNWFSNFKLRASWGKLGNQNVGAYYPYISSISPGQNYSFDENIAPGIAPVSGANSDIKWEETTQTNFGLDGDFWKGKMFFSADYFIKNTNDILLAIPVDASYGKNAPIQNAGSVRNKGWEFTLGYRGEISNLIYNIVGNATLLENEVTDLHGTGPIISGHQFMEEGYPINSYYGYISEGIFQNQQEIEEHANQSGGPIEPGDLIYSDLNYDGVIDGKDRTYLGSSFPKVTYGMNATVEWKGFDINLLLQGTSGVKGFVSFELLGQPGDNVGKATSILLDAWTPENPSTKFPRLWSTYTQNEGNTNPSSFWIRNSSYLRLKNIQLGYSLPKNLVNRMGMERGRIFYSGQNVFTLTPFYKWVDPEMPAKETGRTYPHVLTNSIGLSIVF